MKKSIAFIGALFMGSIAFAQVSKNVNTNKTPSRKVLDTDVKDLPPDPEANIQIGEIKGESLEKHKGNESAAIHKGGTYKGTSGNQKDSGRKSASDPYLKVTSENKATTLEKTTIKVSGEQSQKTSSDPYLKVTSEKKSNVTEKATIKVSGEQSQKSTSDIFLKITDIKGEKEK